MKTMQDLDLKNKKVLIREDLNVPLNDDAQITSDLRIKAVLPTIEYALKHGAAVILMSHLGRPEEGKFDAKFSLAPVANYLTNALQQNVALIQNWQDGVEIHPGQVVLLENVRFNPGEKADDAELSKQYASLCDVFVMDAFATAHRAQASTHGVANYAAEACAGPLLAQELSALQQALTDAKSPFIAIVGGSKVSSKLTVLESLIDKVDQLIVGGGIANTFIAASGYEVGKSLYEPDLIADAQALIKKAEASGSAIPIPTDVVVTKTFSADAQTEIKAVDDVAADDLILDIGPETAKRYTQMLTQANTIVWNGPVGVFELSPFAAGTKALALAIAESSAFTVAGGGDTLAAIDQYHVADKLSYISTGGGAFLELLEGKILPGVAILNQ